MESCVDKKFIAPEPFLVVSVSISPVWIIINSLFSNELLNFIQWCIFATFILPVLFMTASWLNV